HLRRMHRCSVRLHPLEKLRSILSSCEEKRDSTTGSAVVGFPSSRLFYAAILPIWEGYDEPFHFAYIQYLVSTRTTPTLATHVSRQVDASLHVLPLPWTIKSQAIPKPLYTHDDFWRVSAPQRELLTSKFKEI